MAQKKIYPKSTSPKWKQIQYCQACHLLSTAYLFTGEIEKARACLKTQHFSIAFPECEELLKWDLFAAASIENHQGQKEEALALFDQYLSREKTRGALFVEAATCAAECALELKKYDGFHTYQKMLLLSPYELRAELLAAEELASLGKMADAQQKLEALEGTALNKEVLLLKGTASLKRNDPEKAVTFLEMALSGTCPPLFRTLDAREALGRAYLTLAKASPETANVYLDRAESCFAACAQDARLVGMCSIRLRRYFLTHDEAIKKDLVALASENIPTLSRVAKEELALLLRELEPACQVAVTNGPAYMLEAIHEIKQEQFPAALSSLRKAREAGESDSEIISKLLLIPTSDAAREILALTEKAPLDQEAFLSRMIAESRIDPSRAIQEIEQARALLPENRNLPALRHLLATLYIKVACPNDALREVSSLIHDTPSYPRYDHLLFLESALTESRDFEKARSIRKELVSRYPTSEYAPEAAFREFPEKEYELASPHAMHHLMDTIRLFGTSPFAIACHYYLGSSSTSHSSLYHFHEADRLFDEQRSQIPEQYKDYFNEIEKHSLLALGRLGDIPSLQKLGETFPDTKAEASYLLAEAHMNAGDGALARKELESLIEWHSKNNLETPFLAKSYYLLALEEERMKQFQKAQELLSMAEKSATRELLLEVRIAKSLCLKEMGRYDDAMVILSRVINDNLASSLRLKAMFLRAELYGLKKRHDLAIKQLEACAKKGGEWGKKAREKLEYEYGYQ
jgi:tetratricopeptide (TPR) repeat protein